VGGKVYQQNARWQRLFHLLILIYLLGLLAVVILPEIAPRQEISEELRLGAQYGLPLILLVAALLPTEPEAPDTPQVVDFFYSVFVMLVLGIVILGSFTFMTLGRVAYLQALTYTVFVIAGMVLVIGLTWDPRTGYAGLNVFVSRYLFSIGLPMEKWLYFLAELSQVETRPERFLAESVAALMRLPWIAGVEWRGAHGQGAAGERTTHHVEYENSELALTLHSRYRTSPALHWHLNLLGQLLGEFYIAKLREQKLKQQSYLEAVHETGARMTHDVKNLLQSLNALCAVAAREPEGDSAQLQALIRRQLPVIARRLGDTLDRLQQPNSQTEPTMPADEWWESLALQYRDKQVEFAAEGLRPGVRVPRGLFGSVADNLLQNALAKRAADAAVGVRVTLDCRDGAQLQVCDTGHAVPSEVAASLLRAPVRSDSGLGIGLYQAARQAEASGYALELTENRDGQVCFALSASARAR